jgi:hypothetical protein
MALFKNLTKLGNSSALVINRSLLDILDIPADGRVQLTTDGQRLTVQAAGHSEQQKGKNRSPKAKKAKS